jgi:GTPase SAR1 family protein
VDIYDTSKQIRQYLFNFACINSYNTAGQEEMQDIRDQYIKGADGFLVCYDVSSDKSFRFADDLVGHIKQMKRSNPPIILIGNKK